MRRLVVDPDVLASGCRGRSIPDRLGCWLADPENIEAILRDPDDDHLVALAREAGAETIVSGDKDLLDHPGVEPSAIDARSACKLLGLLD